MDMRGTVLVVDDDPGIVELLEMVLTDAGYQALTAVGEAALSVARQMRPDLILLDLMMPGMDGRQVSALLRADPQTAGIPIVVMSGQTRLPGLCTDLPVDDQLPKPFTLDRLYAIIARWAQKAA